MIGRYSVAFTPDRQRVGILDHYARDWCSLPDRDGQLRPLEWTSRAAADAWLTRCRRVWALGGAPAPKGWRPEPVDPSPWAADDVLTRVEVAAREWHAPGRYECQSCGGSMRPRSTAVPPRGDSSGAIVVSLRCPHGC